MKSNLTSLYDLFVELALMVSLGVIVYLLALSLPRLTRSEEKGEVGEKAKSLGVILPLDWIDAKLDIFKDKVFRRLKVLIMRMDNFLSKKLNNNKDNI